MYYCPDCLKGNRYHNVIPLTESCYICENDDCLFCVNLDQYQEMISTGTLQKCCSESNNISQNNYILERETEIAIIATDDSFIQCEKILPGLSNRDNLVSNNLSALDHGNIHSTKTDEMQNNHRMQSEKSISHLNESNKSFYENCEQSMDMISERKNCPLRTDLESHARVIKHPKKTAKSVRRTKENAKPQNSRKSQNSNHTSKLKSGDITLKLQQSDNELETNSKKSIKSKENKEKINKTNKKECKKSIKTNINLNEEHKVSQHPEKIFNWLSLPLEMSIESKISCFFATHLNLYRPKVISRDHLDTVQTALAICNYLASVAGPQLAQIASYSLLSYLHQLTPGARSIGERDLDTHSEHRLIEVDQYLPGPHEMSIESHCPFCFNSERRSELKYAIKIPDHRIHLNIKQECLEYKQRCGKCARSSASRIKVAMKKVPNHIVLQFPTTGLHDGLNRYNRNWTISGRRLQLVGVVEVSPDDTGSNWHNSKSTLEQFLVSQAIRELDEATDVPVGRLTLHFRDQTGWYKLTESGMMSSVSQSLEVVHLSHVQYLIYGIMHERRLGCDTAAVDQLLETFSQPVLIDPKCGPVSNQPQSDDTCRSSYQSVSSEISLPSPQHSRSFSPDRSISHQTDSFNHHRSISSLQSSPAKSQSSSERYRSTPGSSAPVFPDPPDRCSSENNQYRSKSPLGASENQEDLCQSLQKISVDREDRSKLPIKLSQDLRDRLTRSDKTSATREDSSRSNKKTSLDQQDRSKLPHELSQDQQDRFRQHQKMSNDQQDLSRSLQKISVNQGDQSKSQDRRDRLALPDKTAAGRQDPAPQTDSQSASSECSSVVQDRTRREQETLGSRKRQLPGRSRSPRAWKRARSASDSSDSSHCASLHSQSTASQFSDDTEPDVDLDRDRVCPVRPSYRGAERGPTPVAHRAGGAVEQQLCISSSGVSSISSSHDQNEWLQTPLKSHHSRSTVSQFSSTGSEAASSTSSVLHPMFRKRVLSIDNLIEHKRCKIMQSKSQ